MKRWANNTENVGAIVARMMDDQSVSRLEIADRISKLTKCSANSAYTKLRRYEISGRWEWRFACAALRALGAEVKIG